LRTALLDQVNQLRQSMKLPALQIAPASAGAVKLQVKVKLAPGLKGNVWGGDTLFVFAQDPAGPPMPLAVKTFSATPIPKGIVELTDDDAPMPTRTLSSVDHWRVVARVSKSGRAQPQKGDLEGSIEIGRAEAGKPVVVTIDRVIP
jgi:cytochrome c-type biogenesis protein CcmH